jgi:hypothetical protein
MVADAARSASKSGRRRSQEARPAVPAGGLAASRPPGCCGAPDPGILRHSGSLGFLDSFGENRLPAAPCPTQECATVTQECVVALQRCATVPVSRSMRPPHSSEAITLSLLQPPADKLPSIARDRKISQHAVLAGFNASLAPNHLFPCVCRSRVRDRLSAFMNGRYCRRCQQSSRSMHFREQKCVVMKISKFAAHRPAMDGTPESRTKSVGSLECGKLLVGAPNHTCREIRGTFPARRPLRISAGILTR